MIQFIEASQPLPVRPMFLVLYSEPGIGKTSLSFTAKQNVLFIDFDKGVARAVKKKRPLTIIPEKWADFFEFVYSKKEDGLEETIKSRGIKTIVLDTIGAALDDFLSPHLVTADRKNGNGSGGLGLVGFGAMQTTFNNVKAKLTELGLNVVAVCHAREEGEDMKRWTLNVKGGSKDIIQRSADMIGFMYLKGGKRMIDFQPKEWHIGKDIADFGEIEVPGANSPEYDNFICGLFDRSAAHMLEQGEEEMKFIEAFENYKTVIDSFNTPSDFVGFQQSIAEIEDVLLKKNVLNYFRQSVEKTEFAIAISEANEAEKFEGIISEISVIEPSDYKEALKNVLGAALKRAKMKYDVNSKKVIAV